MTVDDAEGEGEASSTIPVVLLALVPVPKSTSMPLIVVVVVVDTDVEVTSVLARHPAKSIPEKIKNLREARKAIHRREWRGRRGGRRESVNSSCSSDKHINSEDVACLIFGLSLLLPVVRLDPGHWQEGRGRLDSDTSIYIHPDCAQPIYCYIYVFLNLSCINSPAVITSYFAGLSPDTQLGIGYTSNDHYPRRTS